VINACFVHPRWCLSGNYCGKIPELKTSWCSISQTVGTDAFVDHGGFPLRATINSLCNSQQTPAVRYTLNCPPFASLWIYLHPTACGFLFLLLPVLRTIFKCASWGICSVAASAVSQWTNLCLRSCCVPRIAVFDVAPENGPVFDPFLPGGGGCVCMMCGFGIGEEDQVGCYLFHSDTMLPI
jgi:hypothetical protein